MKVKVTRSPLGGWLRASLDHGAGSVMIDGDQQFILIVRALVSYLEDYSEGNADITDRNWETITEHGHGRNTIEVRFNCRGLRISTPEGRINIGCPRVASKLRRRLMKELEA